MRIDKLSFGVGDRFAHQAIPQLKAFQMLRDHGVTVVPVWNKSNREHTFIGSEPQSVYDAARSAVAQENWTSSWHVDADHIRLQTVDRFLPYSDFFTIDVADSIGQPTTLDERNQFADTFQSLCGQHKIEGIEEKITIERADLLAIASKYGKAIQEAAAIYRHIEERKGRENFIAEVSMDETDQPQSPRELLVLLGAFAEQKIEVQTIAPKFTGRFNKGVDYVGDLSQFEREFREDLAVLRFAVSRFGLPSNLKLSIHSGSDKFSLYPIVKRCIKETGSGIHIKTAGTTWLEELIGLCEAGGDGLALAKEIYRYALDAIDELCNPYASVIDIDRNRLPQATIVDRWDGAKLARTIRHIPSDPDFNSHVRQLLHVAFKLAAKKGDRYYALLELHAAIVGKQVTENIYERHMKPLFLD